MSSQTAGIPPFSVDPNFSAVLKRLREQRGLSQEKFVAVVGLTGNTIGQMELAKAGPTWVTFCQIATGLGMKPHELALLVEEEGER
jgi:transcriptional regulator with XRE-family HTH domain